MNFKLSLLSTAIAASLLTACGGSSSSGSTPDLAPVVVPEPTPVEPLDYTLTNADIQGLGKGFIAGMDAQTMQLSAGLGKFSGSLTEAFYEIHDHEDGYSHVDGIKENLWVALEAIFTLESYGTMLREAGEVGLENYYNMNEKMGPESGSYVLGTIYDDYDQDGDSKFQFLEDVDGNLQLNTQTAFEYNQNGIAVVNYTFTYIKSSVSTAQLLVSGTVVDSTTGLDITLTNASFAAESIITGSKASLSIENITVLIDDVTISASASAELIVGGAGAEVGTLYMLEDAIPFGDVDAAETISALTGVDYNNDGEMLNLVNLEISDLRIDVASGEYLTADSILFEDADAADYIGQDGGYGVVAVAASYEFNTTGDALTLSNEFGTTTYTYTSSAADGGPVENTFAQLSCVSIDENFIVGAPEISVSCDEDGSDTNENSLAEALEGRSINNIPKARYTPEFPDESATSGVIEELFYMGVDSTAEPITFSISANGEIGLADGLAVPYQLSLNHPGAYNYQAQVVVGAQPTALTAKFSTIEKDIVVSSALPFVPADSAYAPTEANIVFTFPIADLYQMGADFDEETHTAIIGTLTVDGITVAELKAANNINRDADVVLSTYLEFVDGTYPTSGGLFTTVNDMRVVDCPVVDEVQEEGPCFADQAGVIDVEKLVNTYFDGMPTTGPFFEPEVNEEEAPR